MSEPYFFLQNLASERLQQPFLIDKIESSGVGWTGAPPILSMQAHWFIKSLILSPHQ